MKRGEDRAQSCGARPSFPDAVYGPPAGGIRGGALLRQPAGNRGRHFLWLLGNTCGGYFRQVRRTHIAQTQLRSEGQQSAQSRLEKRRNIPHPPGTQRRAEPQGLIKRGIRTQIQKSAMRNGILLPRGGKAHVAKCPQRLSVTFGAPAVCVVLYKEDSLLSTTCSEADTVLRLPEGMEQYSRLCGRQHFFKTLPIGREMVVQFIIERAKIQKLERYQHDIRYTPAAERAHPV